MRVNSIPRGSVVRPVLATGKTAPNSRKVEAVRRKLNDERIHDSTSEIALETGKDTKRVYRELEGESDCFSLDVALATSRHVALEVLLAVWGHALRDLGLEVLPVQPPPLEEDR